MITPIPTVASSLSIAGSARNKENCVAHAACKDGRGESQLQRMMVSTFTSEADRLQLRKRNNDTTAKTNAHTKSKVTGSIPGVGIGFRSRVIVSLC